MKYRLDQLLVLKKLATTRSQAKQLIEAGKVFSQNKSLMKSSQSFSTDIEIKINADDVYVSRGAYKLKAAIEKFNIDPANKIILDVGASTGGFTDYLLQQHAKKIYAIDVGKGQLAEKLKKNPKVINMESTDVRKIEKLPEKAELAVIDLSFISLRLILKKMLHLLTEHALVIALFKPQFEAGPKIVGKDGVIKDPKKVKEVLGFFQQWCKKNNFKIHKYFPSPIKGKQGNQEYLFLISQM